MWRAWIEKFIADFRRESRISPPPFKASKRTATIMCGLWYGRMSPEEARILAAKWGFTEESIDHMILVATQPPSYWSRLRPELVAPPDFDWEAYYRTHYDLNQD